MNLPANLPMKRPTAFLPALADEEQMIDAVATQIAMVRYRLQKEYGLEFLPYVLRQGLREGRQPLTSMAIDAAEKDGDEICDAELRTVYLELSSRRLLTKSHSDASKHRDRTQSRHSTHARRPWGPGLPMHAGKSAAREGRDWLQERVD